MTYRFLKNLFWKEIKMFKGNYPSLTGNYRFFLGFLLLMVLGMSGLIITFYSLFSVYLTEVSLLELEEAGHLIIKIILLWLTVIIFLSSIQDSGDKFFNSEFNFLLSTPVMPWLLFILRLLKSSYLSMNNNFLLLFFGIGPLIGFGILFSVPWYNYIAIAAVVYLYLMIPAALGIIFVMMIVRLIKVTKILQVAMLFNFILIGLWLFFMSVGQEVIISRQVFWLMNFENYVDKVFFLSITSDIIKNLVMEIPIKSYKLTVLFFPMIITTLLLTSLITKNVYQVSYEKVRMSAKKKALPTINISWFRLFKRKMSPFRRFLLLIFTQYKLVFRNHITALWSMVYLAVILFYLLTITVVETGGSELFPAVSVILIVLFTNLCSNVFFKPASSFDYYKLSPLRSSFLIWSLLASRLILQFTTGAVFTLLLGYVLNIKVFMFINLFILLIILLSSIESFAFLLNIMEYSKKITSVVYYFYFAIITSIMLILNRYGYELAVWILILMSFVVFVLSVHFCERQWDKMET